MSGDPKISICVPVYNNEQYLPPFLDSALRQTFRDYEIVLADNHSTDGSMDILKRYQRAFPDKIFVYQTDEHGGAGKGRNLAFQKSRGSYIYWCDSDDLINPSALEMLFETAIEHDADLVCASFLSFDEVNGEIVRQHPYRGLPDQAVGNERLIGEGTHFWRRLVSRKLVERIGLMPENIIFEDVRYVTLLNLYAEKGRMRNFPVYYHLRHHNVSTTFNIRKDLCVDSVEADKYVLQHGKPEYLDCIQAFVAGRNEWNLQNCWQFFDIFVKWIHELSAWFYDNELIKNNRHVFDRLRWADNLSNIQFPNIVYVDGFDSTPTDERLEELREKVFHDGCEIVVLSEKTCDIEENAYVKRAYDRGDLAFVSRYFALKRIYENGGIFIHEKIRLLNYFSYLKYQNAFFALIDKTTYSDWIFGASAGNEAIGAILKTYSDAWDKKGEFFPLSERISIILTAKYGVHQDGKGRLFHETVSVLPPNHSVVDTRFGSATRMCAFEHDFSDYANDPAYITLPRSSLKVLMAPPVNRPARSPREIALERELADMKKTNTYKLMMKIRQIGDGPMGPFLKKIFHGLLKLRKKFKRK